MSPQGAQGDYISDLPPVLIPGTELPGGFVEIETRTGPGGAWVNKKLTIEQLADYVGPKTPLQIRTYWSVIYLTRAEALADGRPDNATLDQIPALLLCTGSVARVDLHPDLYGQEMIMVYDDRADPTVGLRGFIDSNFQRTTLTYDGLQPLKWVKKGSAAEALAGIRRYSATYAKWTKDETMKIDFNGTDAFFSAVAAGGPFPAPTAAGVATADWKPTQAPAGQGSGGGLPAGAVYRDPYGIGDNLALVSAVTDAGNTWANGDLTAYANSALQNAGAPPADPAGQNASVLVGTADVAHPDTFDKIDAGGSAWHYVYGRRNDGTSGWTRTPKG